MTPGHRAHHSKVAAFAALACIAGAVACGSASLPRPERTQVTVGDYVAVPFAPRPPPVEIVPPPPRADAVWVDGTWEWTGDRYRWQPGAWVLPPPGAKHARWLVVRRDDGQLFFAASTWKNPSGAVLPDPPALVRARSRPTED